MRRRTDYIVVHCSASPPSQDIGADEIDRMHRARGFFKIGYHFVIRRNGEVELGRLQGEAGAHARGFNDRSVGVCLVGGVAEDNTTPEANFTDVQWASLLKIINFLRSEYPGVEVVGHRDLPNVNKACPSFDVRDWLSKQTEV